MTAGGSRPDLDLLPIDGGTFLMGSSRSAIDRATRYWAPRLLDATFTEAQLSAWLMKEFPAHVVHVRPFLVSRFPVTNAQFSVFVTDTGRDAPESMLRGEPDDHPVWGVTHDDACGFCSWLDTGSVRTHRLPTEAEWEYAARGWSWHEYPFGDHFDPAFANTAEAGIGHTTPVDRYLQSASQWGVVDLAGNVEEWTSDLYRPYPGGNFVEDHISAATGGSYHVLRGGSFARGGDLARCARRHGPHPAPAYRYRGFRVVKDQGTGTGARSRPTIQDALGEAAADGATPPLPVLGRPPEARGGNEVST